MIVDDITEFYIIHCWTNTKTTLEKEPESTTSIRDKSLQQEITSSYYGMWEEKVKFTTGYKSPLSPSLALSLFCRKTSESDHEEGNPDFLLRDK